MKKVFWALAIFALVFSSCRKEGKDGSVYLKIKDQSFYKVLEYLDDNEQVPASDFKFDREYLTYPGTYNYIYRIQDHDSTVFTFEGTYTLVAEKGEDGGFMKNAKTGLTRHYVFECTIDGSELGYDYIKKHPQEYFELPNKVIVNNDGCEMIVTRKVKITSP